MGVYSDNPKYLFEHIHKNPQLCPLWITKDQESYSAIKKIYGNKVYYSRTRIKYFVQISFAYLRSKVIIIRSNKDLWWMRLLAGYSNRTIINVSHGTPLKVTGILTKNKLSNPFERVVEKYLRNTIDWHLVSSKLERYMLSSCYQVPPFKFPITGYPRNEIIYDNLSVNFSNKTIEQLCGKLFNEQSKVVLYAPTHRDNKKENNFNFFEGENLKEVSELLEKNNAFLLLRTHEKEYRKYGSIAHNSERIKKATVDLLKDINEVLHQIDVLVTDYSGIVFDYLVVNRPIIFFPYDLKEYKILRGGFLLDYPMFGPAADTFEEFRFLLDAALTGEDKYADKRRLFRSLFHETRFSENIEEMMELLR